MASGDTLQALHPFPVDSLPPELTGAVVAIGNFDGVHRGHQALLAAARAEADRRGVRTVVLTFEPHPRTMLRPEAPVFRLTPLPAKARVLRALGIDGLAVATFDAAFAGMRPDAFVQSVLSDRLKAAAVVVGFNFRFGRGRAGNADMLRGLGEERGFGVRIVAAVEDSGAAVASSDIRAALGAGDIGRANALLGYRWFALGRVERGEARGRGLGFPTANLRLPADCALRHGVYAVRVQHPGGAIANGVASYGVRPTFGGGAPLLETYVFDFAGDLYGQELAVSLAGWIRPEAKFADVPELVGAMSRDAEAARAMLAAEGAGSALDAALAALP